MTRGFTPLYRTCQLNGATEQQQFFGNGRFTRVRVRDDGESATPLQF
jgi:hypothetical protein